MTPAGIARAWALTALFAATVTAGVLGATIRWAAHITDFPDINTD